MLNVGQESHETEEYSKEYYDDVSGQPPDRNLVRATRIEEIVEFKQHTVYTKAPSSECIRVTGKNPIGSKWIDVNKGDSASANYRSR